MKTLRMLVGMVVIVTSAGFVFSGCDALSKATEIDLNMPINLTINARPSALPNAESNVVDLSTNKTFNDNKSRIKGADITTVSMILTNYTGEPVATSALFSRVYFTLKFDPSYGDNTVYTIGEFNNVLASDFIGTSKAFTVNNGPLNSVLDNVKNRPLFTVTSHYELAGGATGSLTSMNGTLTINFKLTASPL